MSWLNYVPILKTQLLQSVESRVPQTTWRRLARSLFTLHSLNFVIFYFLQKGGFSLLWLANFLLVPWEMFVGSFCSVTCWFGWLINFKHTGMCVFSLAVWKKAFRINGVLLWHKGRYQFSQDNRYKTNSWSLTFFSNLFL